MRIILFDDKPSVLLPFTLTKPSWEVPLGGLTLKHALEAYFPEAALEEHFGPFHPDLANSSPALAVHARLLPTVSLIETFKNVMSQAEPLRALVNDEVAYAFITPGAGGKSERVVTINPDTIFLQGPWDIVKHLDETLRFSATVLAKGLHEAREGVFVGDDVRLHDCVITRTDRGPIVIGSGTQIESFVVLEGPLVIGERSLVRDHAKIACSALGQVVKAGGEIEWAIMDSYSNKQHHGFLGHSMVASWTNIGAGACTSDLKHTYGTVRVDRGFGKEETGMQFCGCFIGDGSRVSINANLMAGTVLGVSAFVIGTAHGFVPSFTAVTPRGLTEIPFDTAWRARERAMARRNLTPTAGERDTFAALYERTAADRAMRGIRSGPIHL